MRELLNSIESAFHSTVVPDSPAGPAAGTDRRSFCRAAVRRWQVFESAVSWIGSALSLNASSNPAGNRVLAAKLLRISPRGSMQGLRKDEIKWIENGWK